MKKAIEHEIGRQERALAAGETVLQETRLWDPGGGATKPMRGKEEAMDYRYFPDPDLGALVVDRRWREEAAASLPELPEERAARLAGTLGLPTSDADLLCLSRPLADYYEAAVAGHPRNPKGVANWLLSELLAQMPDTERQAGRVPVTATHLAELVARIDDGTISGKIAKELLPELAATGKAPSALIAEKGVVQITDETALSAAVAKVLAENAGQVATYRGGKAATLGWFVGQVMKATGGRANPALVNKLLRDELDKP